MTSTNFSQLDSGGTGAPRGRRLTNSTSIPSNNVGERRPPALSDTALYSNSPHFHQTPHSSFVNVAVGGPRTARSASYVAGTGNSMRPRSNTRSARNGLFNVGRARQIDTDDESIEAKSDYGGGHGIRASVRRWYSTMDVLDFGRRSKFNAEYFGTDDDHLDEDYSQMEDGRGSYHAATREGHLTEQHVAEEGNGQGKTRQRGHEISVANPHECHAGEKGSNAYGHDARDHFVLYGHILVVRIVERRTNGGGHGTEKKERQGVNLSDGTWNWTHERTEYVMHGTREKHQLGHEWRVGGGNAA
ncbi:hypothetical protein PsorP6_017763 [Peronosclerospora sorghi]|uniref:Uncharacterized protein n=1 Tax=Peronosclerospora sorghi TaxID=230839 RepID=A0ACC0WNC8_9STRA|nr:hypothetical protein PsorP6_017763 [Peronosclerospora sorghi]